MGTKLAWIREGATRLIAALTSPEVSPAKSCELAAALRPRDEDYDAVFCPASAAVARRRYGALWRRRISFRRDADPGRLIVAVAGADDFAGRAEPARYFPREYLRCAG